MKKLKISRTHIARLSAAYMTITSVLPSSYKSLETKAGTVYITPEKLIEMTIASEPSKEITDKISKGEVKLSSSSSVKLTPISVVVEDNIVSEPTNNLPDKEETIEKPIKTKAGTPACTDLSKYGVFTVDGMTKANYESAMAQKWEEVTPIGKPITMNIDLTKSYSYVDMENIMINLAKYDGVYLYKIGKTEQGRTLYSLNIDFGSDFTLLDGEITASENIKNKEVLLCTGQVHAREFAGSMFILKQFNDLVKKAQTDPYTKMLLQNVIYVSIPCVNPDGREIVRTGGSGNKKTNANGVDINRNFAAMNGAQLSNGNKRHSLTAYKPGDSYFEGYQLGSESETRVAMKWLDTFVPYAKNHIDYHQQGKLIYRVKDWLPEDIKKEYDEYAKNVINFLNKGVSNNLYKLGYEPFGELDGRGGTITDYATSVAMGQIWSNYYGRMVLEGKDGEEIPLLMYNNLGNVEYTPVNPGFVTVTLELTKTTKQLNPLGYSSTARKEMAKEYDKYNYATLLTYRAELALGSKKLSQLKNQLQTDTLKSMNKEKVDNASENEMTKSLNK